MYVLSIMLLNINIAAFKSSSSSSFIDDKSSFEMQLNMALVVWISEAAIRLPSEKERTFLHTSFSPILSKICNPFSNAALYCLVSL